MRLKEIRNGGQFFQTLVQRGTAGNQPLRERMLRMMENLLHISLFHHIPFKQNHHIISNLRHHPQIMGDEDDAHPMLALELLNEFENALLNGHVKGGGRLVGDEDVGVARDGHRNHHALLLAARKFVRIRRENLLRTWQHHLVEQINHTLLGLLFRERSVQFQRLHNLFAAAENRIEGGHRLLKNHPDFASADVAHLLFTKRKQINRLGRFFGRSRREQDFTALNAGNLLAEKAHHRQSRHRLARAGLSHNAQRFPPFQIKRDMMENGFPLLVIP